MNYINAALHLDPVGRLTSPQPDNLATDNSSYRDRGHNL